MKYSVVESYAPERPLEVDEISSQTVTYVRRNIREVPNTNDLGEETSGKHWRMEEAVLTKKEFEWYKEQIESPALDLTMQSLNDLEANQTLADLTTEENHEEQMQMLNDIQADILLIGTEE